MGTPLQIVVTATTAGAKSELQSVQAELGKVAIASQKTDSTLQTFGKKLSDSGSGLSKLKNQLPNIGSAISNVSSEFSGFGSILGGGVVVALAVAVTLFSKWAHSISDTQKAQNALNESLNESQAKVAGEVVSLNALVSIAQNVALSTSARQQAIDKLNKDYPQYLGNLNLENINTEKVKKAIESQTQALIRRAQIKGAENLIAKETENLLKAQTELTIDNTSAWDKFVAVMAGALDPGTGSANLAQRAINNQAEAAKSATTAIGLYSKKLKELLTQSAIAGDLFTPKEEKDPKIKKVVAAKVKEIKERYLEELSRFTLPLPPIEDIFKSSKKKIDPKGGIIFPSVDIITAGIRFDELDAKMKETAQIATSVLTPVFDELFSSIINGSGNAFQSFGNALNQILKQIAITLLKALALGAILAAITGKPFNIGSIISSSIKGFAGGVKDFAGGLALVGERGPELVNLPRGSNVIPNNQLSSNMVSPQIFIANSRIVGNDIVTSYTRTVATNSRNG